MQSSSLKGKTCNDTVCSQPVTSMGNCLGLHSKMQHNIESGLTKLPSGLCEVTLSRSQHATQQACTAQCSAARMQRECDHVQRWHVRCLH